MRSMTLRAFAWLIFCGLTLVLIVVLGNTLAESSRRLAFAERSVDFDKAVNALLIAVEQLSVERGLTQMALLATAAASADTTAAIAQPRGRASARMAEAMAAVATLSFDSRDALLAAVRQSAEEIQPLRNQADAALKLPRSERPDALLQR